MTGLIGTNTAIGDNQSSLVTAAAMVAYERRMCAQIKKTTESARTNNTKNQILDVVHNNNLDDSSDSFRTTVSLIPSGDAQFARKLQRLKEIQQQQQQPLSLHPASNIKKNDVVKVDEEQIATPTIPVEAAILSRTNMDDEKQHHQQQIIPVIPSIILMENIASYVNERLVWNALATLNRECYAISKNLLHLIYRPWPRIRWRAGLTTPKKQQQQPQKERRRRVARGVQVSTRPCTVAFGKDFLCCGTNQGDILVWKVHENGSKRLLQGHSGRVNSVQCYHDWLVSAGDDTAIRIWNVRTMSCASIIVTGHVSSITSVAILPFDNAQRICCSNENDDKKSSSSCMLVATASMDCDVRLFAVYYDGTKVISTRHLTTFTGPELIQGPIYSIVMYKKDKRHYLISGGLIGRLRLWDIDSSIAGILGSGGRSYCAEHNNNPPETTNNNATTTTTTTMVLLNKCIFKYDGAVKSIVVSQDKTRIAAAFGRTVCYGTISDDPFHLDQSYNTMMTNEMIVENETNYEETIDNGNNWRVLKGHSGDIRSIDFSLDGKSIASACTDGSIRLWELGDGTWKRKWKAHNGFMVCSLAISPDGQCLLSAGSDGTIAIETTLT
ncbi:WD40 repeat-like protein [Fragilariopsis cylindrus CCMP1102]|uniref:WD40 repeat-like protein n=1 Tax=Fragilariopsis cylindrus CCMP1102 TaxID=635003 RepID=A0A1E7EVC7_9STRA|nr:WD40 repeat-like protein [Fragilariopsis cylindrus CCMP1102]|eukprot:OEU09807.1 WD40 repeat-like protein [Fragilariopsis cylindrus CCMP1102]